MKQIQKLYPHVVAIVGFVLVAVLYFYPVLQGKKSINLTSCNTLRWQKSKMIFD